MSFGRRHAWPLHQQAPPLQPVASETRRHCANAATDIVAMLLTAYTAHDRVKAESAVAAAAALTGEFALRSTGLTMPEGGVVRGNAADDVLFAGAREGRTTAWMFITQAALQAGVAERDLPPIEAIAVLAASGATAGPPLSVPEQYAPRELPMNFGPRFRHRILATADTHDLSLREITIALGAATGQLILRTQNVLPAQVAVTLAAEVMLSVSRTAPLVEAERT